MNHVFMKVRDDYWFDQFWENLYSSDAEDDGLSAIAMIGMLIDSGVLQRHGDYLSRGSSLVGLSAEQQFLIRRIEDAVSKIVYDDDDDE